ncbi:MAG: carotenoid 1,2-hydratase [Aquincola sp.]|nr:carotenoid 1,2-hydratase [Aquincola sp.]
MHVACLPVEPAARLSRRALLLAAGMPLCARATLTEAEGRVAARALEFPRDHGAHIESGIEWWYATGWLARTGDRAPAWGFQLTFFRSRTGLAEGLRSRFAARQLLFAHAALTDLAAARLVHAERITRWNGDAGAPRGQAARDDTRVNIGSWRFERAPGGVAGRYESRLGDAEAGFAWDIALATTQPLLLQGSEGWSRKGPLPTNASHYYSQPQLDVDGSLTLRGGSPLAVRGRAWLDHEWSDSLLPAQAAGWDWIGINLDDGSALTAFRLRDSQGRPVWAGGSHRGRGGATRAFAPDEVRFEPLAWWTSAGTQARYPVRWLIDCPAGRFELRALLDAQELDARASTGTVYWEGLSELRAHDGGARVGLGYLEMTGYAAPLRL